MRVIQALAIILLIPIMLVGVVVGFISVGLQLGWGYAREDFWE